VPFGDAVHVLGRSALAVAAFTSHPELLLAATEDRIHQRYRAQAYPQSLALVEELREQGIPAAISGAGPSVIAFDRGFSIPDGWRCLEVPVAHDGVRVSGQ
jgi:homoserine kinase